MKGGFGTVEQTEQPNYLAEGQTLFLAAAEITVIIRTIDSGAATRPFFNACDVTASAVFSPF
eukprot:1145992-Pelagomonas_calceolata.AAC.2